MHRTTRTVQGDTLDAVCYRLFADSWLSMLPTVLTLNPHLSATARLLAGQTVYLPKETLPTRTPVRLWD